MLRDEDEDASPTSLSDQDVRRLMQREREHRASADFEEDETVRRPVIPPMPRPIRLRRFDERNYRLVCAASAIGPLLLAAAYIAGRGPRFDWAIAGFLILLGAYAGFWAVLGYARVIRTRRLLRHGAVAGGVIERAKDYPGTSRNVTYRFTPPGAGAPLSAKATSAPRRGLPGEGDELTVFYDPLRPARCVAYEFCELEFVPPTRPLR